MTSFDINLNLKEILKSLLFVSGEGLDKVFLCEKLEVENEQLENALKELRNEFSNENGLHLITFKNKIQLTTNPNYAGVISNVLNPVREKALTAKALETLAIIVYKQPITKLEIEDIRRVNCDYAIQVLLDQEMIEIVGRKETLGHPFLFGTSEKFLKRFNIQNINDLPDYESLVQRIKIIREDENNGDTLFKPVDDFKFEEGNVESEDFFAEVEE